MNEFLFIYFFFFYENELQFSWCDYRWNPRILDYKVAGMDESVLLFPLTYFKFGGMSISSDALLHRSSRINKALCRALLLCAHMLQFNNILIQKLTWILILTIISEK